jgi:hypothetical protein
LKQNDKIYESCTSGWLVLNRPSVAGFEVPSDSIEDLGHLALGRPVNAHIHRDLLPMKSGDSGDGPEVEIGVPSA